MKTLNQNALRPMCRALALLAAICCAFFGVAERLSAAVIYSNLGPNDSFIVQPATYPVWNLTSGGFIHRAASFTVPGTQNVKFGSAELGLYLMNGANQARVQLTANTTSNFPGSVIESIGLQLPAPSSNPVIAKATSQTNPTLIAGVTYWIVASMQFPNAMATWGPNNTGASGGNATRANYNNGQWFQQPPSGMPSLRINAMVPEPSTLLIVLIGAGALAAVRRRAIARTLSLPAPGR